MKNKTEKVKQLVSLLHEKIDSVREIHTDQSNNGYLQLNKTSFEQNFKVLMGHYVTGAQVPIVASRASR